jgi:EmrB/QacA subfamily drug resistance transporter
MAIPASESERRGNPTITLVVLGLAGFIYSVIQAAVLPALPSFQRSLHTSVDGAGWLLITYLLSASVATPIVGRLGDMYGKDRLLVATLVGLCAGTLLAAVSDSIGLLYVARVIQGVSGGIVPLSFGIVRDAMPRARVATSIGIVSSMLGVGGGAGIVLGALVLEHANWHWLFWAALAPTVLITVLAWRVIPPSPLRTPARVNWVAAALMSVGMSGVLIAVSEAASWGWGSPKTLGLLAAGLAGCAAWVAWEVRAREPLVDMRLMRIRAVWTTNLSATLLGGGMYAVFLIVPEFVQEPRSTGYGLGAGILQSGLYVLPLAVAMLIMSLQAGRVARRFGSKNAVVVGSLVTSASFVLMLLAHSSGWNFYLSTACFGFGMGLAFAALGTLIVDAVPRTHTGVASGMNAVMRTLGGAFGAAFVATFIAADTHHGQPAIGGFELSMVVAAVLLALAGAAALLIPSRSAASASAAESAAAPAPAPAATAVAQPEPARL